MLFEEDVMRWLKTNFIFLLFMSLFASELSAQNNVQQDYLIKTLSSKSYSKLRIILKKSNISFISNSSPQIQIVVRKTKQEKVNTLSFQEEGDDLVLKQTVGDDFFDILITGNLMSFEVFVNEGNVDSKGWSANQFIVLQKGKVRIFEAKGDVKTHVLNGEFEAGHINGPIVFEGYEVKTTINDLKGDLKINQHSGVAKLESVEGGLNILSQRTKFQVIGGKGNLDFLLQQGSLNVTGFQGALEGTSDQAPIHIKAHETVNVKIQAKDASVDILVPQKSAAGVTMQTSTGRVSAPNYIKTTNYGDGAYATGRLKGEIPGRLFVKTQSGRISIKAY